MNQVNNADELWDGMPEYKDGYIKYNSNNEFGMKLIKVHT